MENVLLLLFASMEIRVQNGRNLKRWYDKQTTVALDGLITRLGQRHFDPHVRILVSSFEISPSLAIDRVSTYKDQMAMIPASIQPSSAHSICHRQLIFYFLVLMVNTTESMTFTPSRRGSMVSALGSSMLVRNQIPKLAPLFPPFL